MAYTQLPQDLKDDGLFCLWRFKPSVFQVMKDGVNQKSFDDREEAERFSASVPGSKVEEHRSKVPYSPMGGNAKSNDRNTFGSFSFTLSKLSGYDGIGLGLFDGICGIDIDNCIDENGEISELATDIVEKVASYSELSPSGRGIHIYFRSDFSYDTKKYYQKTTKVEMYLAGQTSRFLTVTGDKYGDCDVLRKVPDEDIRYVLDKYMKRKPGSVVPVSDGIQAWLMRDDKLRTLWNSKAPGAGHDESNRDLALCSKLSWYVNGDKAKIDELFRQSPYYKSKDENHVKKWEVRQDYREMTLAKAASNVSTVAPSYGDAVDANQYTYDDTGNAHRFVDMFGKDILYCFEEKKWFVWNSKYWQADVMNSVKSLVENMTQVMTDEAFAEYRKALNGSNDEKNAKSEFDMKMKNIHALRQKKGKENCLSEAQHLRPAVKDDFDRDPWKICCQNAIYDLRTGQPEPFDRSKMMTMVTAYPADMDHEPKMFIDFLHQILVGHEENYDYIHRLLGYAITGSMREDQVYFLYGNGNDGKSLLLDVVGTVIGEYAATAKTDLICANKYASSKQSETQLAQLWRKRFVTIEETDKNDRLAEKMVKTMASSAGRIVARHLYAEEFSYHFTGKIIAATNYKPYVTGTDKGIWRRIVAIPFDLSLPEGKEDKDLKDKLLKEAPQILGWLIKGAVEYCNKGLEKTESIKAFTDEYRVEQDVLAQWIREKCDTTDKNCHTSSMELYREYMIWRSNNGMQETTSTMFGRDMGKKFSKAIVDHVTVYFGIKIRQGTPDLSKSDLVKKVQEARERKGASA